MSQPSSPSPPEITRLLQELEQGQGDSADRLVEAVHGELGKIAEREFAARYGKNRGALTIEPGVLVNDALLKILEGDCSFENRRRFYSYATRIMVNALVSHQRRRLADKRGGGLLRVTLTRVEDRGPSVAVEDIPPLLEELQELDPRKAEVVRLRVFWGMTVAEVAEVLQVSASTVDREWRFVHRWLVRRLRPDPATAI